LKWVEAEVVPEKLSNRTPKACVATPYAEVFDLIFPFKRNAKSPSRTIAIGDIHGCSIALTILVDAIQPTSQDLVVPLGDYIDRGPDSRGVLEQLIALGGRCNLVPLLGNHEAMMLGGRSDAWCLKLWRACGGLATLDSYGPSLGLEAIPGAHWTFLESCRDVYETVTHVFVHAKEGFRLPNDPVDNRPLWPRFTGKVGVVGHAAQKSGEILNEGCIINIDTFCYGGGWLTALDVDSGQVWQANERGQVRGAK
jgi:serine/threonine protein phosphatase 1